MGWGTRIAPELLLVYSLVLLSPVTPLCAHTSYLSKFYENLTPDRDILLIVLPLLLLVYSLFLLRPAPPLFAPNLVFVFAPPLFAPNRFVRCHRRPLDRRAPPRLLFPAVCVGSIQEPDVVMWGSSYLCMLVEPGDPSVVYLSCICIFVGICPVFVLRRQNPGAGCSECPQRRPDAARRVMLQQADLEPIAS